jgi:hypothetical protein
MSIQTVVQILDEIEENSTELEVLETIESYASGSWELLNRDGEDPASFSDDIPNLKPRLVQAILELSQEEAQELLKKVRGTAYERTLSQTAASKKIPARQKFRIMKLLWPEYDVAAKAVDGALKDIRSRQPNFDLSLDERKEFIKTKEKGMAILVPLKELISLKIVNDEFVALAMDVMVFRDQDDIEAFSKQLLNFVLTTDTPSTLEQFSVIWNNLVPETADRKLGPLLLSANPVEKENAGKVLLFMGRNPTTVNQVIGDVFNLSGDFRGANVPIKSTLNDVAVTISNSPSIDEPTKAALTALIKQLEEELAKSPKEKKEEAEAVADTANMLVQTAAREKPNKATLQITADGLKKAALNLAFVLPAIVPIVKQIVSLLTP